MFKWLGITLAVIIIIPAGIYVFTSLNQVDTYGKDDIVKTVKQEVVKDTSGSLKEGIDAYNAGNIDLAAEKFDEVINGNGNKSEAHYYMGMIYKSRDLDNSAKASFQKAINLNPEYLEPKKELMKIALTENDYSTAFELFNSLIDKNVLSKLETIEAYNSFVDKGLCYDSDEGIKLSQKILKLDKNNKYALGILLNHYKDNADQKKYAEYLERYVRNVEYSRYAAVELYNIYYNSEYYTKALGVLDLLEQHGYNSYEIERAREHVKQKRDEYKGAAE